MHGNRIERRWGEEEREQYREMLERLKRREEDPHETWLPSVGDAYWNVSAMEFEVKEEDIRRALKELKSGKAGGLDGLKPELYKSLQGSNTVVRALVKGIERIMEEGGEPDQWKDSRTIMIPK